MAEVHEIIQKMSIQVEGNQQLEQQVKLFERESAEIDELIRKRDLLNKMGAQDKNAERAAKAKVEEERLNKVISERTRLLQQNVQAQQLVIRSAQQELGIIQKLTDKINDLKLARERQKTAQGIAEINNELASLNAELEKLTNIDAKGGSNKGGLLSSLFGIGSASATGRQVLQGVLAGAGIGVGFSIIPAITAHLVEYISKLTDVRRATFEVSEASRDLGVSLNAQLKGFIDLNVALNDAFGAGSSAYGAAIEKTQALGVIEGEVYQDRKRRFEAEQAARENELTQLDEINGKYTQLSNALVQYDKSRNMQGLRETIKQIGLSERDLIRVNKIIDETFSGKTAAQKRNIKLSENDELATFGAESLTKANRLQEAIFNARIAFEKQTAREVYELNKRLTQENADNAIKLQQEEIARQEATTDNINKQYDLRGRLATEALNREVELARKAGTLTAEIQAQFDEKFKQIQQGNEAERLSALRKFNIEQLQLQQKLNSDLLSQELQSLNQRLQLLTGLSLDTNLDVRNAITEKELQQQRAANGAQYDEQVRALEKRAAEMERAGDTETQEYQQTLDNLYNIFVSYQQKQSDAEAAAQRRRVKNIQDGYADVVNVIRQQSAQLQAGTALGFSEELLGISANGSGLFGRDFDTRIAGLRNRRNVAGNTLNTSEAQLGKARAALQQLAAENAPQIALDNAQAEVDRLQTLINDANAEINNSTREITVSFISAWTDAFKQIGDAALQGYNTINDFRQADLQREISARERQLEIGLQLAERGNTEVLDMQREALREQQREYRQNALVQQSINSALQLSYSLLAVAKATAEGGGVASIATVSAAIGALLSGYAIVRSTQLQQQNTGFADGGFTGEGGKYQVAGNVHKGEFVFNQELTSKYRPFFEHIHETGQLPFVKMPTYTQDTTAKEFKDLKMAVYGVIEAVNGKQVNVSQRMDRNGLSQAVIEYKKQERLRWQP